jgi:hypothetical protein
VGIGFCKPCWTFFVIVVIRQITISILFGF